MPPPIHTPGKNVPTVGRRVWFRPLDHERSLKPEQPFDAGIVYVHENGTVNLDVKNEFGSPFSRHEVFLRDSYDEAAPGEAGWMPYQQAQAKASA